MEKYSGHQIKKILKKKIIIGRLELEDITEEEIKDDEKLFTEDGLGLDSVEALDVATGIGEEFHLDISNLTQDEIQKNFISINTMTQFILKKLGEQK